MQNNSEKSNKFTNEQLKEMQNWDLDRKIAVSKTRIIEFYNKFYDKTNNLSGVYVSFSGGKDSTVLLHLVRSIYPDTPAVFVDTGLEYPELREFVKTIPNVTWLKPRINFRQVIETYGYPVISKEVSKVVKDARASIKNGKEDTSYAMKQLKGEYVNPHTGKLSPYNKKHYKYLLDAPFKISSQCCDVMKKQTVHKYERQTGNKPIIGTMANESKQRKSQWIKYGCNAFDANTPTSKPLSFWTEQDILKYIKRYDLSYASVYGDIVQDDKDKYYTTGCTRTGCVFCAYGCHLEKEPNRFQRLKETHPKLWNYCMKPWDEGGLGMREVLDFIGVKIE